MRSFALLVVTALALGACAQVPTGRPAPARGLAAASHARAAYAQVVAPGQVPGAIAAPARAQAQAEADRASERRDIDYFQLPEAPIGLRIGHGAGAAWVLGFLGTGRTDADLNVELRALVAGGSFGCLLNYSGPTTLGRTPFAAPAPRVEGPRFELMTGLPGNGVADAYADYGAALERHLARRYDARPFALDDVPIVVAVVEGGEATGFVFMNQGSKLVLGDRKYADVQNVACLTADGDVAAAYTVVGFNRKTAAPAAAPIWTIERDDRLGTFARCGEW